MTWASVFPLDVIKTRVQAQTSEATPGRTPLLSDPARPARRLGAMDVARETYREGGIKLFFRGLTVCSVRAFAVNAVQWAVYEWIMRELGQGKQRAIEPVPAL